MYKNTLADAKKQQQKQQQQNTPQQQQQILSDKRKIAIPSRRWEQKKKCFLADLSRPKQYQTDLYIAT